MAESFTVCVGKEPKEFVVIESIATRSSKFFQAAMPHDWKEAREKRVKLPEVTVEIFEGYLQWLYTGELTFIGPYKSSTVARVYILGDYLDDKAFRTAALCSIMEQYLGDGRVPGPDAVRLFWQHTPQESPIRQLFSEV